MAGTCSTSPRTAANLFLPPPFPSARGTRGDGDGWGAAAQGKLVISNAHLPSLASFLSPPPFFFQAPLHRIGTAEAGEAAHPRRCCLGRKKRAEGWAGKARGFRGWRRHEAKRRARPSRIRPVDPRPAPPPRSIRQEGRRREGGMAAPRRWSSSL